MYFGGDNMYVPCSEVQQCGSAYFRKMQCWNVKVLVVMCCGHLRAAEEQVSVMMLISLL